MASKRKTLKTPKRKTVKRKTPKDDVRRAIAALHDEVVTSVARIIERLDTMQTPPQENDS